MKTRESSKNTREPKLHFALMLVVGAGESLI